MVTASSVSGYRFGPFELDLRSGELVRNGRRTRLQEKPCSLLVALVERPGEVISRSELHERLWPNDTFVDFEDGLNTAMRKLRGALNDDPQTPRYIETVRGRGYRFIAEVEPLSPRSGFHEPGEAEANAAAPEVAVRVPIGSETAGGTGAGPAAPESGGHRALVLWSFLLGCVLAAGSAAAWYWLSHGHAVLSYSRHDPVLIADFENQTGDPRFDRALGTALAVSLEQSQYVNVYSPLQAANALHLMTRKPDERITAAVGREICQRENIPALVAPGITRIGGNYLITAQLFNPSTGEVLRSYEERARGEDNILAALDTVSTELRRDLGESRYDIHRSNRPLPEVTTPSLEALRAYVDGTDLFGRGQADKAVLLYKAAIAADPGFAMAHAALGYAYSSFYFNEPKLGEQEFRIALALSTRTTDREDAWIETRYAESEGRTADAIDRYRTYLARWPGDYNARFSLAHMLRMNGRAAESIPVYQRLILESPDDAGNYLELATAYRQLSRFPQSMQAYEKTFALDPSELQNPEVNHEYGIALILDGQGDKAAEVYSRLLADADTFAYGQRWLAFLDLYHGRYRSARQRLLQALGKSQEPFSVARIRYMLAVVAAGEGDRVAQIAQLDRISAGLNSIGPKVQYGALLGQAYARAGELRKARKILDEIAPLVNERAEEQVVYAQMLKAEVAAASGNYKSALQFVKPPVPGGRDAAAVITRESLAHVFQAAGKRDEAIAWYRQFLADVNSGALGWEPEQQLFNGYYAVAQDYWLAGDRASALNMLSNLLDRWTTADTDLLLLRNARLLRDRIVSVH
jgi:eukaryotic-like serine/threonine-protein kinase